jgi:hypothetical protein
LAGCYGVTACIGNIGDSAPGSTSPGGEPLSCGEAIEPGPAPIRRMTSFEFDNTLRDLLGDDTKPAKAFTAEEEALGFNNNAAALVTSSTLAEKYVMAAEGISERATQPLSKVLPCDPAAVGEDACALEFIDAFGPRAFRRPLTADEVDDLFALYQIGRADADFRMGIRMVIEAALQSPAFLYRVELGVASDAGEELMRLDSWEMASRLSYFLWGTMPDEKLFDAALAGELETPEQVAQQARRMLDDPRARQVVADFHAQWLDYDRIAGVSKNAALFPDWSPEIGELMRQETAAFIEHAVFPDGADGGGSLHTLLTAPYSYMNEELASFYGVQGPGGDSFEKVDLDPAQRAGLLTTGTLLTLNAHSNQTSPVHRGKFVREMVLCQLMEPPPDEVMIEVPEPDPDSTARERFAEHSANPKCSACHQLMDPLGFGFENYDAIARYRVTEGGEPIDASGELVGSDVDGEFVGAVELAHRLADSENVKRCYVKQWFRYAYGRGETEEDACSLEALETSFNEKGTDVKELLISLTQTEAFLYRKSGGTP